MTTPFACGGLYARGARRSSQPIFRGTHMPKEFLLVHGACHGAWCWEEVAGRLRARGHRVAALDLPGHGRRAAEVRRARVRHLVFLAAVVVPHGGSLVRTIMTPAGREMMLGNAAARGDGT